MAGECAGHQEFAWQEERRTGKSMAVKAAHLRIIEKIVPADAGDSGVAHVLAGAGGGSGGNRAPRPAGAGGAAGGEGSNSAGAEAPEAGGRSGEWPRQRNPRDE